MTSKQIIREAKKQQRQDQARDLGMPLDWYIQRVVSRLPLEEFCQTFLRLDLLAKFCEMHLSAGPTVRSQWLNDLVVDRVLKNGA